MRVPLPGADPERLDVAVLDGELVISTPARRRQLALPRRFAPLALRAARVDGGTLHVRFERDGRGRLMRVLLLTGKGGVGKTSIALATALAAAEHGHRCAVLSTDAAHSLGDALGRPVGPRPVAIAERVTAQEVVGARRARPLVVGDPRVAPGGAVRFRQPRPPRSCWCSRASRSSSRCARCTRWSAAGEHDVCVVDCAPTGSTLRMLRLPDVLRHLMENLWQWERRTARVLRPVAERLGAGRFVAPESVFDAFERLYAEVESVRQILLDEDRTSARLVVNPARVVVDETRRSFAYLSLYGVATDAVLVNRLLPETAAQRLLRALGRARARRAGRHREVVSGAAAVRAAAPERAARRGALAALGREVYGERDPAELFVRRRPVRLAKRDGATLLEIDLPSARADEVDVWIRGDDLFVCVRDFERRFALPGSLGGLPIADTRWRDGVLEVRFAPRTRAASSGRKRASAHRLAGAEPDRGAVRARPRPARRGRDRLVRPPGRGGARDLPKVGGTKNPSLARVLELRPDLVIANREENRERDVERLRAAGVAVWVTYPRTVADGVALVRELAELGAPPERAEPLRRSRSRRALARARSRGAGAAHARLLPDLEAARGWRSAPTPTRTTCSRCAAARTSSAGAPDPRASAAIRSSTRREIAAARPEVILLPDEPYAFGARDVAELAALATPAAAAGRIHCIDGTLSPGTGRGSRARSARSRRCSRAALEPAVGCRSHAQVPGPAAGAPGLRSSAAGRLPIRCAAAGRRPGPGSTPAR